MSAYKKTIAMFNLKGAVVEKVKQYQSPAMAMIKDRLGETVFREFVALPDDEFIEGEAGFVPFEELDLNRLMRREIETAQAYFIMYLAVVGIKEFELGSVALDKISFGEGDLNLTGSISIERYQATFLKMGNKICSRYSGTGELGVIII